MKNLTQRIIAVTLAAGLGMGLSACGGGGMSTENAVTYVQGIIDENYLGTCSDAFKKLVDVSDEDIQETYEDSIGVEVDYFLEFYEIEYPTDELRTEITDLYKEIYQSTKVEVVSAAKQDDGSYSVKLNVEPIDIVHLAEAEWDDTMAPFYEKYPSEVQDAMNQAEYEAMDQEWARMIVDLYQSKLPELGHLDSQAISVQLEKDDDGYYSITDEDFGRLDALIIDYNY